MGKDQISALGTANETRRTSGASTGPHLCTWQDKKPANSVHDQTSKTVLKGYRLGLRAMKLINVHINLDNT